ncbi:Biopolymer transport protein ExbD/TolR [Flavobacterium longum]|uniref:ExbD/TolR family protein n=1 Tax=Flavobacterium longum TaxID=1299340 RepID=UPI0039E7A518
MAELQHTGGAKTKKIRSRKLNAKVDLTAMVDLAFLLITFFMLTTTLSKPKSMALLMPDKDGQAGKVDENRTLTILIGADDKARCYMGIAGNQKLREVAIGTRELRNEIKQAKQKAHAYSIANNKPDGLIVIIKPDKTSNYGNLVDVLDEMEINDVATYAIADIEKKEIAMLR